MHCCFGSQIASNYVGITDTLHLYLSMGYSESDWKKPQRTKQTKQKKPLKIYAYHFLDVIQETI